MYCNICQHSWCWTCGYPDSHFFHGKLFNGFFCELINAFTFGFEFNDKKCKIHWFFRLLLSLIGIVFAPIVALVGGMIGYFALICDQLDYGEGCTFCWCVPTPSLRWWNFWFLIPLILVNYLFFFALWMAGVCIAIALGTIPFYIGLLIVMTPILCRWCCQSKKVRVDQEQKREDMVEQYRAQNAGGKSKRGGRVYRNGEY